MSGPITTVAVPGTELPVLEIPVTRTLIIAGAIASRDFEPVHHDHVIAQERGSADLFMNILTSNGLIGRFVTDWTGPGSRLRRIDIRLGVPAYPGDTLRFTGTVVAPPDGGAGHADAGGDSGGDGGTVGPGGDGGTGGLGGTVGTARPGSTGNTGNTGGPGINGGTGANGQAGPVLVTVAVRAANARGDHAWGTVEVEVAQP